MTAGSGKGIPIQKRRLPRIDRNNSAPQLSSDSQNNIPTNTTSDSRNTEHVIQINIQSHEDEDELFHDGKCSSGLTSPTALNSSPSSGTSGTTRTSSPTSSPDSATTQNTDTTASTSLGGVDGNSKSGRPLSRGVRFIRSTIMKRTGKKIKGGTKKTFRVVGSIVHDFTNFVANGRVAELAIGLVIGAAFTSVVQSSVNDIIAPVIGLAVGSQLDNAFVYLKQPDSAICDRNETLCEEIKTVAQAHTVGAVTWNYGAFIQTCLNFRKYIAAR
jgi:large conductance mechanosensitive channel protein